MNNKSHTYLFGGASDETLVQPESLFLGETLSLVVPEQGALNLSHTNTKRKQENRAIMVVYKVQSGGGSGQVHWHRNKKTKEGI